MKTYKHFQLNFKNHYMYINMTYNTLYSYVNRVNSIDISKLLRFQTKFRFNNIQKSKVHIVFLIYYTLLLCRFKYNTMCDYYLVLYCYFWDNTQK